jgi:hypothetical protein
VDARTETSPNQKNGGALILALALAVAFFGGCSTAYTTRCGPVPGLERIAVSPDKSGFVATPSKRPFVPWGMNYGNSGRLMEDFWEKDWETFAVDIREMKSLGANVVRVHLQYGKFMSAPDAPNESGLRQLGRMLALAEEVGIYLDITGLATYRPADTPAWYDATDTPTRWRAQEKFWEMIAETCAQSPAVFCYDLMNEPISPGDKKAQWHSGSNLGGYDFLQFIARDPEGKKREDLAVDWIRHMTTAIRRHDQKTMITVGLLPWDRNWKFLSGFIPEKVAPELDFISVHIYPNKTKPDEAMEGLAKYAVGKPVVIEETFPLSCGPEQLEKFMLDSRQYATGWIGHYDGLTIEEINALERDKKMSVGQSIYRSWLRLFVKLKPQFGSAEIATTRSNALDQK